MMALAHGEGHDAVLWQPLEHVASTLIHEPKYRADISRPRRWSGPVFLAVTGLPPWSFCRC